MRLLRLLFPEDLLVRDEGVLRRARGGVRVAGGAEDLHLLHGRLERADPLVAALGCVIAGVIYMGKGVRREARTSERALLPVALVLDVGTQRHLFLAGDVCKMAVSTPTPESTHADLTHRLH